LGPGAFRDMKTMQARQTTRSIIPFITYYYPINIILYLNLSPAMPLFENARSAWGQRSAHARQILPTLAQASPDISSPLHRLSNQNHISIAAQRLITQVTVSKTGQKNQSLLFVKQQGIANIAGTSPVLLAPYQRAFG